MEIVNLKALVVLQLKKLTVGTTYYFLKAASGSAVTHPYLVGTSSSSSSVIGWYKEAVFPYATFTVSYNANGGSGTMSSHTATIGTTVQLSSNSPTRTRYKFLGWSTNSSTTSASYQPGANYSVTGNITLYAIWQLLDKDIYLYKTGEIDAVDFKKVSSLTELFDKNGYMYGTDFLTHSESNIYICKDGKIYAKAFIKY